MTSRDSVTRFFASGFFPVSVSPRPQSIPLGPFWIFFQKIANIVASQGAPPVSKTPAANFATSLLVLLIPVAKLPPVSTIPAANLTPVPTTSVANCRRYQRHWQQIFHRRTPVANNENNYMNADRISLLHGYYSIWLQLMFKWFDDKLLFCLSAWLLLHTVWLQRLLFWQRSEKWKTCQLCIMLLAISTLSIYVCLKLYY